MELTRAEGDARKDDDQDFSQQGDSRNKTDKEGTAVEGREASSERAEGAFSEDSGGCGGGAEV